MDSFRKELVADVQLLRGADAHECFDIRLLERTEHVVDLYFGHVASGTVTSWPIVCHVLRAQVIERETACDSASSSGVTRSIRPSSAIHRSARLRGNALPVRRSRPRKRRLRQSMAFSTH